MEQKALRAGWSQLEPGFGLAAQMPAEVLENLIGCMLSQKEHEDQRDVTSETRIRAP